MIKLINTITRYLITRIVIDVSLRYDTSYLRLEDSSHINQSMCSMIVDCAGRTRGHCAWLHLLNRSHEV